jgi:hypothetical protein
MDGLCDWCDSPAAHRRVSATDTVQACRVHYSFYLAVLRRRRMLASRVTGR